MLYESTRGGSPALTFTEAAARGLAPDGGLYIPREFPDLTRVIRDGAGKPFARLAAEWLAPLCDDIPAAELLAICESAWREFPAEPAPVVRLDQDIAILELFRGPTLAFKDFALQFLGRLQSRRARLTGERITVLGATSGDTGAAAVHAVPAEAGRCVILYPLGRIAPLAERQMLCGVGKHTRAVALEGDFDTCQAIVKKLMGDEPLRTRLNLSAVNSINIARIVAQSAYYGAACARLGEEAFRRGVSVVVPTGNFGNALAADFARRMGAPIVGITAACNANDTLARYVADGEYRPAPTRATLAPAMDISIPSNFERWLRLHLGAPDALNAAIAAIARDGAWRDTTPRHALLAASAASDADIIENIRAVHRTHGYVADPHTACALRVSRACCGPLTLVASTAHPAKFPETMRDALGFEPAHPALEALKSAPLDRTVLPATAEAVKAFLG